MSKFYVYTHPNASQRMKDFLAEHFGDGIPVSAVGMGEMTGGLDGGPPLRSYSAVLFDGDTMEILAPVIPDDEAVRS